FRYLLTDLRQFDILQSDPRSVGDRMQFDQLKRREFITLLGGSAAAWSLAARAQQPNVPVIGFLRSTSLAVSTPMVTGFRQGLTAARFIEGQNVAIEYRYADNQLERLPGLLRTCWKSRSDLAQSWDHHGLI